MHKLWFNSFIEKADMSQQKTLSVYKNLCMVPMANIQLCPQLTLVTLMVLNINQNKYDRLIIILTT